MADTKELKPVAWQRRLQHKLPKAKWEQCHAEEATGHFERRPGYEYRPLYSANAIERLERERDELLNDIRIGCANIECAEAELTALRARLAKMEEALIWYENNVAGCRLIHSGGDAHRNALARDGGARAAAAREGQP